MHEQAMMFSGGVDTTLAAARLLETGEVDKLHLMTFCNGFCVGVDRSRIHADELSEQYGSDRVHHEVMYVTELFAELRSPLLPTIRRFRSTLVFDLCCRLSMETRAILYALEHGIDAIADGTNIDQGKLFLERPEYLAVSKAFFDSFGIRYYSPVYGESGGREGRWQELVRRGFTVGPKALERVDINACVLYQPFCLMGIHTFFFTSFMRNAPLLRRLIGRANLSLERAIELRRERQVVAREWIQSRVDLPADSELRIADQACTTRLCGHKAVELSLPLGTILDVDTLEQRWRDRGEVSRDGAVVRVRINGVELQAFPNGRVLVSGTRDRQLAQELFEQWVAAHDVLSAAPPRT